MLSDGEFVSSLVTASVIDFLSQLALPIYPSIPMYRSYVYKLRGIYRILFEQVEEGIILEDDCVPHPDFFTYCTTFAEEISG